MNLDDIAAHLLKQAPVVDYDIAPALSGLGHVPRHGPSLVVAHAKDGSGQDIDKYSLPRIASYMAQALIYNRQRTQA